MVVIQKRLIRYMEEVSSVAGKLYIVGTPIGNLKDITLRALEVLKSCDLVAAEDTRVTMRLLSHFEIKKPLISYHKFNEEGRSENILDKVREGQIVALVSDAGMPGISDPGAVIIEKAVEEGIDFEVIPGPTAVVTALVNSTLDTTKFAFRGFFPRENKDREEIFKEIEGYRDTIIFYEAPHRIVSTLEFLKDRIPNRRMALSREITKTYEETIRGTVEEVYNKICDNGVRGEIVILIEGKSDDEIEKENRSKWEYMTIEEHIDYYIEKGNSKKEAIKLVAKERGISKREVYACSY